jgi:hypothetical protein
MIVLESQQSTSDSLSSDRCTIAKSPYADCIILFKFQWLWPFFMGGMRKTSVTIAHVAKMN